MFTSSLRSLTYQELAYLFEGDRFGYSSLFLISDSVVASHYEEPLLNWFREKGVRVNAYHLPVGEQHKSLEQARLCWRQMAQVGCDRRTLVLGLGGGVVTDLAGFVASGFMRGVDYLAIPTSLVGMVDAAIGGKCGVNLPEGKNLVGAFWPARDVILDPALLSTLPLRHFRAGLAEVVKTGVLMSEDAFVQMEATLSGEEIASDLILSCAQYKSRLVEQDPRDETGIRALLNLGHTFAHAIEKLTNYTEFLHGEAVAIGLVLAARLGERLERTSADFSNRLETLLLRLGLPTTTSCTAEELLPAMRRDKKNVSGQITCIIAEAPGKVFAVSDVDEESIAWAINNSKVMA